MSTTEAAQERPPEGGRRLNIFVDQVQVGTLHEDNDLWTLEYHPDWVARAESFDLSPALSRSQLLHRDGATLRPVQWYFENLLPEGDLRGLISEDGGLRDRDDAFAFLEYLGTESSGSLTLLPVGRSPYGIRGLQPLPHEELSRRILALPRTTLTRPAPKQAAFAGAQHKMLAVLKGLDVYEPLGSTSSTHILKPDNPWSEAYPASAYLEWLTVRLAASAHLRVPRVELFRVPQPVYAIERFDRLHDPAELAPETGAAPPEVRRVHAIDACQLLNRSRLFKHGAGVRALREASQACTDTVTTAVQLFRWLLFNLLVANDDCHLKNLSFLVTPGRIELSPHYDLLATGVYRTGAFANERASWPAVPLAVRLSAEVTRFDQVTPQAVLAAALELGVPEKLALQMTRDVVTKVLGAFDATYAEHYPQQERLLTQLNARATRPAVREFGVQEAAAAPASAARAPAFQPTALENAQQLRILMVLRYIVLPEMVSRVLHLV